VNLSVFAGTWRCAEPRQILVFDTNVKVLFKDVYQEDLMKFVTLLLMILSLQPAFADVEFSEVTDGSQVYRFEDSDTKKTCSFYTDNGDGFLKLYFGNSKFAFEAALNRIGSLPFGKTKVRIKGSVNSEKILFAVFDGGPEFRNDDGTKCLFSLEKIQSNPTSLNIEFSCTELVFSDYVNLPSSSTLQGNLNCHLIEDRRH
jgi:hypothetical protein